MLAMVLAAAGAPAMSAAPPGPIKDEPMPPSAELEAAEEMVDAFMPGKGQGDRGMVAAERVVGSKAGDDEDEIDCFRTDLNARDVEAAMVCLC